MSPPPTLSKLLSLGRSALCCRGCLGPLDPASEAGLCSLCWAGLLPLQEPRCPRCALGHDPEQACPEPVAWEHGDALWDYHGGRPALGALLVPGIKSGELGWKKALLRRAAEAPLPAFTEGVTLVTSAPATPLRRLLRGFDLAEELARILARHLDRPYRPLLRKAWGTGRQGTRTESERRRLPRRAVSLHPNPSLANELVLLVDDVWTTGSTLLRCAQALREGGAQEVRVLSLFRAL